MDGNDSDGLPTITLGSGYLLGFEISTLSFWQCRSSGGGQGSNPGQVM
jgi:hypothetical protein